MKKETTSVNVSLAFCAFVLFIVFLILKLCNAIDWSWWWVTSPLWIYGGLLILYAIVWFSLSLFIVLIDRL